MNIFRNLRFFCFLLLASFTITLFAEVDVKNAKPVKYVFLFVGDGMGTAQRQITEAYSKATLGRTLAMNDMPFSADTTTTLSNGKVTDSAAAATAIACGVKAKKASLGINENGESVSTCAEDAKKAGKKIGIISTSAINHATPAGFYAHSKSRGDVKLISQQALDSGFDFFAGASFIARKEYKVDGNKEVFVAAKDRGYTVVKDKKGDFDKITTNDKKVIASYHLPRAITDKNYRPSLADFLTKAIEILDNPNGFFIMCEGSAIDWVCHANDIAGAIFETLALDDAVRVAVEFAKKHPNDTLIITTGDHETGGLDIVDISKLDPAFINKQKNVSSYFLGKIKHASKHKKDKFSFDYAMGKIEKYFNFNHSENTKLTEDEIEYLRKPFYLQYSKNFSAEIKMSAKEKADNKYEAYKNFRYPFDNLVMKMYAKKVGLNWTTQSHTKRPLLTTAMGKNAELVKGKIDNTDIGKILKASVK